MKDTTPHQLPIVTLISTHSLSLIFAFPLHTFPSHYLHFPLLTISPSHSPVLIPSFLLSPALFFYSRHTFCHQTSPLHTPTSFMLALNAYYTSFTHHPSPLLSTLLSLLCLHLPLFLLTPPVSTSTSPHTRTSLSSLYCSHLPYSSLQIYLTHVLIFHLFIHTHCSLTFPFPHSCPFSHPHSLPNTPFSTHFYIPLPPLLAFLSYSISSNPISTFLSHATFILTHLFIPLFKHTS